MRNEEQRALLGLWAVSGVGPKSIAAVRRVFPEGVCALGTGQPRRWLQAVAQTVPLVALRALAEERLSLFELADLTLERAAVTGMGICFPGEPCWPARLSDCQDAPPLLFHRGGPSTCVPRVGMVGTRHPESGFLKRAEELAQALAVEGVGVVSGAAVGVDQACHDGALEVGQQTWAFLGSALDEIDAGQRRLVRPFLEGAGVLYSELPPGVRASTQTFPRRNRLISGASDAVLVLRAGKGSGSLHTALAALAQGRPLWALPGDHWLDSAYMSNRLVSLGYARLCPDADVLVASLKGKETSASERLRGLRGMGAQVVEEAGEQTDKTMSRLSEQARLAYQALTTDGNSLEDVMGFSGLAPAALTSALCELELFGFVVQHPGRRFAKVRRERSWRRSPRKRP
jgi:DNA processing protein